jgi:hypothetical protein
VRSARDPHSYHLSPRLDPRPPKDSAGCWQAILRAAARVAGSQDSKARHADRTRSPVAVSRKREYFKYPPETIGDFALIVGIGRDGAPVCKRPQLAGIYAIYVSTISS